MTLSIQPIKAVLGAEVSGIDLSRPLADATQQELNALFTQHAVLVFRDQPLTPPQFMQAAQVFDELMPQQIKKVALPDYPKRRGVQKP